ncbi:MAG TPA: FKBP-type peptidyl-prolyl cis-trans isomerase [Mucilaginibacter sp.]|nr:FKBP-type peptidyl-prolyl cis-trans isomerase [Mucilaginibacter sp.]
MLSFAQSAATAQAGFKEGPKGLLYRIYNAHTGPTIQVGDFISVDVVARSDRDSVLTSTYEQGSPGRVVVPKAPAGEAQSALVYLTEGDSATVKVNIDSLSRESRYRMPVNGKYIIYDLKIEKLIPRGSLTDTVFNAQIKEYLNLQNAALKLAEPAKIKKYIADHNLAVTVTPSGLSYVITQPGTGDRIAAGDTAVVWYTARFVSGKLLESNMEQVARQGGTYNAQLGVYKPLHILAGMKLAIPGWDEGLLLLNKGARATFIMPSALAYGEQGFASIPPYTPLVFEIEVVDVVRGR